MLRLSTFASDVLAVALTGFSTASSGVVTAADSVVAALGKLQAQMSAAGTAPATNGTATLNFGAAPGATDTTLAITGQAGILATSHADAWLVATATADHSIDEHWAEDLQVVAGNIVPGVGFTIYGACNTGNTYGAFTVQWVWV